MKDKSIYNKILSTIGMSSTNLLALERMKEEIEDLNNPFTNTPFYLSPIFYQEKIASPCDADLKQDALRHCNFAIDYFTKLKNGAVNLLNEAKSEEKRISNDALKERFVALISDKETKRAIVLFLKDYSLNRQIYNNTYNKNEKELEA